MLDHRRDIAREIVQGQILHRPAAAPIPARLRTQHSEPCCSEPLGDRIELIRIPPQ